MELDIGEVDLADLVSEAADLVRPIAERKSLDLRTSVDRSIPPVLADRDRIYQVLSNLLANAVKFTERGSVTVSAALTNGWVTVSVSDTGIGVAAEEQSYIFDEFRQADASTTRKYGGTGLGLAICRTLVTLHGGRIWVESPPGGGSTFRFTLPVAVRAGDVQGVMS